MVSVLGLDVGQKRIGVAGCDGTGLIATGLTTVHRQRLDLDLQHLQKVITQRRAEAIVIGLPRNMNGTLGFQAQKVQNFGTIVEQRLGLPVYYEDERLSTVQAQRSLIAQNISAAKRKTLIDQQAAAVILQQWLNRQSRPTLEQEYE